MYDCLYFIGFSGDWKGDLSLYCCASLTELPDGFIHALRDIIPQPRRFSDG